jgi:hypothetical protein
MSLPRTRRLLVPLILALVVASMAAGCSKEKDPLPPPPDIPEADVDDIAQQIAAMTASDNGGWFFTVQTMAETLAAPLPASPALAYRGGMGRFRTLNTFSRTQAGVTHDWKLGYFDDLLVQHAVRDSAVAFIDAGVTSNGGTLNANGLSSATYGLFADSGQYTVEFVEPASDTVQFDIFLEDSSFALVGSVFHAGSNRLWYQANLISTTDNLLLVKAALPSPYPVAGSLEWSIDARIMGSSGRRDDFAVEWLAEGEMTFNGTQFAVLKITVGFGLGSPIRSYRVDLKTGAITKL